MFSCTPDHAIAVYLYAFWKPLFSTFIGRVPLLVYGTRQRVHVKSVYPYRVPFREIVVHQKCLTDVDASQRVAFFFTDDAA